ncbi:MAG: hypothetical protein VR65_19430 [Desulfobulbaceae bacterium BRH_c16a]|nr:MAG: hypothetical protein VR65_19430 [Desulfobulbaceae bacterium BRH_c16a]
MKNQNPSLGKPSFIEVAVKYRVEDLRGASIPGSRMTKILEQLESGQLLSNFTLEYLHQKGFLALYRYAQKEISFTDYLKAAEPEKTKRFSAAEIKAIIEETEQNAKREALQATAKREQERAAAKKRAFDNDPKNIARAKQFELREKYDLSDFIEKANFPIVMDILRRVDNGIRLSEEDIVWLTTKGGEYYTIELREEYHRTEAEFYAGEFQKSKDPWSAVNASSHYRKCGRAKSADSMLITVDVTKLKNPKLKSAICTTHGGVKRDLRKFEDALGLGEQAHLLTPKDFRPCTLLGAVNIEIGHYDLGQAWYKKAVERGASEKTVDDDLRSIFMRAEKSKQEDLRDHLLKIDPVRYSWVRKKLGKNQSRNNH